MARIEVAPGWVATLERALPHARYRAIALYDARGEVLHCTTTDFGIEFRQALNDALDHHSQELDLIIADYTMPGFSGTAALTIVRDRGLEVPFIFVSGTIGEEIAVEAMKNGADDYIIKNNLNRLLPAIGRPRPDSSTRSSMRVTRAM